MSQHAVDHIKKVVTIDKWPCKTGFQVRKGWNQIICPVAFFDPELFRVFELFKSNFEHISCGMKECASAYLRHFITKLLYYASTHFFSQILSSFVCFGQYNTKSIWSISQIFKIFCYAQEDMAVKVADILGKELLISVFLAHLFTRCSAWAISIV